MNKNEECGIEPVPLQSLRRGGTTVSILHMDISPLKSNSSSCDQERSLMASYGRNITPFREPVYVLGSIRVVEWFYGRETRNIILGRNQTIETLENYPIIYSECDGKVVQSVHMIWFLRNTWPDHPASLSGSAALSTLVLRWQRRSNP